MPCKDSPIISNQQLTNAISQAESVTLLDYDPFEQKLDETPASNQVQSKLETYNESEARDINLLSSEMNGFYVDNSVLEEKKIDHQVAFTLEVDEDIHDTTNVVAHNELSGNDDDWLISISPSNLPDIKMSSALLDLDDDSWLTGDPIVTSANLETTSEISSVKINNLVIEQQENVIEDTTNIVPLSELNNTLSKNDHDAIPVKKPSLALNISKFLENSRKSS